MEIGPEDFERRRRKLRWVADGGAAVAMGISAAIMLLWALHATTLAVAMPFLVQMKANTTLGFGAAGAALLLLGRERPRAAAGLALISVTVGLVSLAEYLLGANLLIDELLFSDWSGATGGHPGRPSPNTATALAALGVALIALAAIRPGLPRRLAVKFLSFAVIAVAMACLAGHVAGSAFAIGWGSLQQMSIPSALCALALGVGIMAHSWQTEGSAVARIPVWIPALLGFAILLFDVSSPLEIDAGICYIPLVWCALWFQRAHVAIIFAAVSTLLIVFGFFASPPGSISLWIAVSNRGLDIAAVWAVAILVYMQRSAELRLQRSARHLSSAQQIAGVGSFELKFATMILNGSREFDTMLGRDPDSNRHWDAFARLHIPPDERTAFGRMAVSVRRGERSRDFEFTFLRADGVARNAILHCDILFNDERVPTGIIGVVHDVTELRQSEARQTDIEAQLRHAQKLEALGTLAGGIAHDLNNTLVPITTLVPFMLEDCAEPSDRRSLEIIMNAAGRAKVLIREILSFSRKDPDEREAIRLDLLARDTLTLIRAGLPASIHIIDELEPVPEIFGSKGQIYQTILNLATNAAHSIGDRAGTVVIGATCDGLVGESGVARVRLYVADDGTGMDDETKARIFEPFFSTKDVHDGTGLGLAIVSGIVASHGGSISVESAPGKGSRFDLWFPAVEMRSAA
jgi:signal transduction histidine kinase